MYNDPNTILEIMVGYRRALIFLAEFGKDVLFQLADDTTAFLK